MQVHNQINIFALIPCNSHYPPIITLFQLYYIAHKKSTPLFKFLLLNNSKIMALKDTFIKIAKNSLQTHCFVL